MHAAAYAKAYKRGLPKALSSGVHFLIISNTTQMHSVTRWYEVIKAQEQLIEGTAVTYQLLLGNEGFN